MAIFGRRQTQLLIDETAAVITRRQIKKIVDELNAMPVTETLSPDWELLLLNAFSKIGRVEHEQTFGGNTKPDLFFQCRSHPNVDFVADIRTVSDKGFKDANPFAVLFDELLNRVQERGLRPLSFSLEVGGNHRESQRGQFFIDPEDDTQAIQYKGGTKTRLKMPGQARFAEKIFNKEFEVFLSAVESAPHQTRGYGVFSQSEDIDVKITYDPTQKFAGGSHLEYRRINHLTQNALYQALEQKAAQVIDSQFNGTLGVIICDGGFTPFHSFSHFSTHTVEQVIAYFFSNNPRIDFVLTFVLKKQSMQAGARIQFFTTLYSNTNFKAREDEFMTCLNEMLEFLPTPRVDAFNALNRVRVIYPNEGGYIAMQNEYYDKASRRMVISARILLELLAGRMSYEEFAERYGFVAVDPFPAKAPNPFSLSLQNGALIRDVGFQKGGSEVDDDAVIIELSDEADPAISPFRYPPKITTTMSGR